jgi:hypothetical protein
MATFPPLEVTSTRSALEPFPNRRSPSALTASIVRSYSARLPLSFSNGMTPEAPVISGREAPGEPCTVKSAVGIRPVARL